MTDPSLALKQADDRYLAVEGTPGPERDAAGAARREAMAAYVRDLREPITSDSFTLSRDADGILLSCAGMFTTTPLTTPATAEQIDEVAKTVWKRLHPYPDLQRGDADCEGAWSSQRNAAIPRLRTLIAECLRFL